MRSVTLSCNQKTKSMFLGENTGVAEYQIYKPVRALLFTFEESENLMMPKGLECLLYVDIVNSSTGAVQPVVSGVELLSVVVLQDGISMGASNMNGSEGNVSREFYVTVKLSDGALNLGNNKYLRVKLDTTKKIRVDAIEDGFLTNSFYHYSKKSCPQGATEFDIDTRQGEKLMLMAGSGYMRVFAKEREYEVDLQTETHVRCMSQSPNYGIQNVDITLTYSRYLNWFFSYPLDGVEKVTFFLKDANSTLNQNYYLSQKKTII